MPTGTVMRPSDVIRSATGRVMSVSNRMSRFVRMPTSLPSRSTMGTPLMEYSPISRSASARVACRSSVIGSTIMPDSERFTLRTISACASTDIFLWMTPMPPRRAMAMAICVSVTVSMAADTMGRFRRTEAVRRAERSTSFGSTRLCAGTRSTSSKVSAVPTILSTRLFAGA